MIYFLYVLLVCGYFLASLLRVSASVTMPSLVLSMQMNAVQVGLISSLFFYAYSLTQPFSGNLCDKRGPLLVCGLGLILMSTGIAIFGVAPSPMWLALGWFTAGFGAAASFSGTLVFQANAFSKEKYAGLAAITVMFGHLGGVMGVLPLGTAIDAWGRSWTFIFLALVTFGLGSLMFISRKRDPVALQQHMQGQMIGQIPTSFWSSAARGFRIIASSQKIQAITFIWSAEMALQMTLIGLWGVPWLVSGCGISIGSARQCMTIAGIGIMPGALIGGWVGTAFRGSRNALLSVYLGITIFLGLFIAGVWFGVYLFLLNMVSFSLGLLLGMCKVLCSTNLNEVVNRGEIGSAIGAINTVIFSFVMLQQFGSGLVLNFFQAGRIGTYPPLAYLITFTIILLIFALAGLPLIRIKNFRNEEGL